MQLHPWNPTDAEAPFFSLQRAFDRVGRWWRAQENRAVNAALTISLAPQSTITLDDGEIELLDDSGTLWVTRECDGDLLLRGGERVRVRACGRTVVQALSSARVRIAKAA